MMMVVMPPAPTPMMVMMMVVAPVLHFHHVPLGGRIRLGLGLEQSGRVWDRLQQVGV
jgi:hypothetical protein